MNILSNFFGRLFSPQNTAAAIRGFDAVWEDLYERSETLTPDVVEGRLTADGVKRITNDGAFDVSVEIGLSWDLGKYGVVPYAFPMPDDPRNNDEEFVTFVKRLGFPSFEDFLVGVAEDGVTLAFERDNGEWRIKDL